MKFFIVIIFFLQAFINPLRAQNVSSDYRSLEDGISKLINNVEFLDSLGKMNTQQLAKTTINILLDKYVPEYKGFKADGKKIDMANLYYAANAKISPQVSSSLGKLLGLGTKEMTQLQSIFTGKFNPEGLINDVTKSTFGSELMSAVNNPQGYLKGELHKSLGGGAITGKVIDKAFNWLAKKEKELAESEAAQKAAAEAFSKSMAQKAAQDVVVEKGRLAMGRAFINVRQQKYDAAISGYDSAINFFRESNTAGYRMMKAMSNRARAKLAKGDNRGAILDYYYALNVYNDIETGKIPVGSDLSLALAENGSLGLSPHVKSSLTNVSSSIVFISSLSGSQVQKLPGLMLEKYRLLRNRAYAKYQLGDFKGVLADCKMVIDEMKENYPGNLDYQKGAIKLIENKAFAGVPQDYVFLFHDDVAVLYDVVSLAGMANIALKQFAAGEEYLQHITRFKNDASFSTVNFNTLPEYTNAQVFLVKAFAYTQQKDYGSALKVYDYLIKIGHMVTFLSGNDAAGVYFSRAGVYLKMKEYAKALEDINAVIDLNPTDPSNYLTRADVKTLMGDKDGATKDKQLAANPAALENLRKAVAYYNNKIVELENKKDNEGLLKLYEEAIIAYPNQLHFAVQLAGKLRRAKSHELALAISEKLPLSTTAYFALKSLYNSLSGNNALALDFGLKAFDGGYPFQALLFDLYPQLTSDPVYCQHAQKFAKKETFEQDNFDKIKPYHQKALEAQLPNESTPGIKSVIAFLYYQMGEPDKAIEYVDKSLNNKKDGVMAQTIAVKIKSLFLKGNYAEAVKFAKKYTNPKKFTLVLDNDQDFALIQNIAADKCGYDKK